jgi:Family of unknown function (DUF5317)
MKIPFWYLLFGPILLFALGFTMNATVMAANHGQMPVLFPGGCTADVQERLGLEQAIEGMSVHSCMTKETRLKFLADWIVIRHLGVASPGDLLEWASDSTTTIGLILWIFAMITRRTYA